MFKTVKELKSKSDKKTSHFSGGGQHGGGVPTCLPSTQDCLRQSSRTTGERTDGRTDGLADRQRQSDPLTGWRPKGKYSDCCCWMFAPNSATFLQILPILYGKVPPRGNVPPELLDKPKCSLNVSFCCCSSSHQVPFFVRTVLHARVGHILFFVQYCICHCFCTITLAV